MRKILTATGLAAAVLAVAACGSSSSSSGSASSSTPASSAAAAAAASSAPASSSGSALMARTIGGSRVLTNASGFTLYWFGPDTSVTSKCTGSCATYWPPVTGPATAGSGVTGQLGVITRTGGGTQATYDGHPLYTYAGDTAPGQNNGNHLNASGGLWYEVTVSGTAPAASPAASAAATHSANNYGY